MEATRRNTKMEEIVNLWQLISERRKKQLKQEGIDERKAQRQANEFYDILRSNEFSIREAQVVASMLNIIVDRALYRDKNEILPKIKGWE